MLTAFWGTLFQLAISPFNWIDSVMEGVVRRVGVMLDKEAARAREGKETEEQNLEDFRRKYPWWLNGRGGEAIASTGKDDSEDTVTLFEGKNTRV